MKQTTIIAIALGVVMLVSLIQASQLIGIKTKFEFNGLSEGKSSASSTPLAQDSKSNSASVSLPSNIENLPNMVGGC